MSPAEPGVSVVLTTYRRAKQLPATIESILAQSYGDFELIVSDDASPDETESVVRSFGRDDPRVRYRRNPSNLNMPGNLNAALREARAPLVANLHDGDVYRSDLLARWKSALDRYRDAAFVFNACDVIDDRGRILATYEHEFPELMGVSEYSNYMMGRFVGTHPEATRVLFPDRTPSEGARAARFSAWLSGPFGSPVWGTVMARRECYARMGWFDPRFGFISDVDMWLRLNDSYPVAYLREPLISLAPRGKDRPHSSVNWQLERALVRMFLDCASRDQRGSANARAKYSRAVRRAAMRRWAFLSVNLIGRGHPGAGLEGLRTAASAALRREW